MAALALKPPQPSKALPGHGVGSCAHPGTEEKQKPGGVMPGDGAHLQTLAPWLRHIVSNNPREAVGT